jgi:hypothetical protein
MELKITHIQELIENKVSEGKEFEYKRDKIGNRDPDKKEFLQDISSFANSATGYVILGIEEGSGNQKGIPNSIIGIEVDSLDQEKLRLESMIRDGIEPRIHGIQLQGIMLDSDSQNRVVMVIKIPKSLSPPHMVKFQGSQTFYSRNSGGKYRLDVSELRNLFGLHESYLQWIRNFRIDRVNKIISGDTPLPLNEFPLVLIHTIPINAYNNQDNLDLSKYDYHPHLLHTISSINGRQETQGSRYNFDGFVTFAGYLQNEKPSEVAEYTQLYRNGIVEAVWSFPFSSYLRMSSIGEKNIPSLLFEEGIIKAITYYLNRLKSHYQLPVFVMVSLLRISGYKMITNSYGGSTIPFTRDTLIFPEIVLSNFDSDISTLMKQTFDIIWNSVGEEKSIYYNEDGSRREDKPPFRF